MSELLCPVEIPLKHGDYDLMGLTNGFEGARLTDSIFNIEYGYCEHFIVEQFASKMMLCSHRAKGHLYTWPGAKLNVSVTFEVSQDTGLLEVRIVDPNLREGLSINLIVVRGNVNRSQYVQNNAA